MSSRSFALRDEPLPAWLDIYVGVAAIIFYIEMVAIVTVGVYLPPPPEPWFMKPKVIIIEPRNPYEYDLWRNTWEERFI